MEREVSIIKRLGFIKYLYNTAISQSLMPAPMSSVAILMFHDAIEQFLILAYTTLDGTERTKNISFMQYWDKIKELPNGVEMKQKGAIEQLKNSRVNLKHHGHLIQDLDIETYRATANTFFKVNTPLIFGIKFTEISLADLIQCKETKNYIKKAEKMLRNKNLDEALDNAAYSFFYLIEDYENRKKDLFGNSPFFFGRSMTFDTSVNMGLRGTGLDKLGRFVDKSRESIISLADAMKILSLGIDFRKYAKFKILTPKIFNSYHEPQIIRTQEYMPNKEDVEFCINFVIESAINLQEFDFDIVNSSDLSKESDDITKSHGDV